MVHGKSETDNMTKVNSVLHATTKVGTCYEPIRIEFPEFSRTVIGEDNHAPDLRIEASIHGDKTVKPDVVVDVAVG